MDNGHYRAYEDIKFREDSLVLLNAAKAILMEYEAAGYKLTVRGLHYKLVTRHKDIYANTPAMYNKLVNLMSKGRIAGRISWTALEDSTRNLRGLRTYEHPAEAISEARENYRRDLWATQPFRPEVWFEKQAAESTIAPICNRHRVDYFGCRGYSSQSEQWRAGQRFADYIRRGQVPIVFHIGDHDPSGIDMTRDNRERLAMFAGVKVTVVRLGLNIDQIRKYNIPPDPAKLDDPRAAAYIKEFGPQSWELDALEPATLSELIGDEIRKLRNEELWQEALEEEANDKDNLDLAIERMRGGDHG